MDHAVQVRHLAEHGGSYLTNGSVDIFGAGVDLAIGLGLAGPYLVYGSPAVGAMPTV